jgi:hypothetical protein
MCLASSIISGDKAFKSFCSAASLGTSSFFKSYQALTKAVSNKVASPLVSSSFKSLLKISTPIFDINDSNSRLSEPCIPIFDGGICVYNDVFVI